MTRILAIATHYRGHLALRPGDTSRASQGLALAPGQMSWYQRKPDELGMFILREYPSTLEECFQSPVEGAIYAELIDKLRAEGAIRPWKVDRSALVHTCWDLGSPINTCVWFFQVAAGEILSTSTWISI